MNTGTPTDDEKNQVKLNQQVSDGQNLSVNPPLAPITSPPNVSPTPTTVPPPPPPISPAEPPATSPKQNIGVGTPNMGVEKKLEAEEKPQEPKIEVQATDIPIKSYDNAKTTETPNAVPPPPPAIQTPDPGAAPQPPIKANGSPAAIITVLAILALVLGGTGGFLGFRYLDKNKTAASTENPSPSSSGVNTSTSPSTDISSWPKYQNDQYKFSIQYPDTWVKKIDESTLVFASNEASLSADPSEFKVEINFQDANGKTLKSWVEANAVTTNEKGTIKEIAVSGTTAYQQEQTNLRPAVSTYIERGDKVMIVTLTAPASMMTAGGEWYNKIINSITLL